MNVLLTRMLSKADPSEVPGLSRFFKTGPGQYGEGDKFLGIKVPVTRAVVKECWRSVSFQDLEECITSPYHEVRLAALLALVEVFSHAGKRPPIRSGVTSTEQGVTKEQCIDFYLSHTAIWEQRIGIVSTMTFIRSGQLKDTFRIADILLHHPHDLIHKAVGWLLREAGKRDKAALEAWLQPRASQMPRTMLRYAIERFPEEERRRYLLEKSR